jgi:hypothetical protein
LRDVPAGTRQVLLTLEARAEMTEMTAVMTAVMIRRGADDRRDPVGDLDARVHDL